MTELRVYLRIEELGRQFAAYMGSSTRGRGYVPLEGMQSLIVEIAPALFAAVAANEAERVAPRLTLVDCQMIGASGRIFLSGSTEDAERARDHILKTLEAVEGREK